MESSSESKWRLEADPRERISALRERGSKWSSRNRLSESEWSGECSFDGISNSFVVELGVGGVRRD